MQCTLKVSRRVPNDYTSLLFFCTTTLRSDVENHCSTQLANGSFNLQRERSPSNDTTSNLTGGGGYYDVEDQVQDPRLHIRAMGILYNAVESIVGPGSQLTSAAVKLTDFVRQKSVCGGACANHGVNEYCVDICSAGSKCDITATKYALDTAFEIATSRAYYMRYKDGSFIFNSEGSWHACVRWRQPMSERDTCPVGWCK